MIPVNLFKLIEEVADVRFVHVGTIEHHVDQFCKVAPIDAERKGNLAVCLVVLVEKGRQIVDDRQAVCFDEVVDLYAINRLLTHCIS